MPGCGETGVAKAEGEQGSASKQQKMAAASWCADCWAAARATCLGPHRVMGFDDAKKAAAAEVDRARVRLGDVTVARARQPDCPVLQAEVVPVEKPGFTIPGGNVRIRIATSEATARDKANFCRALQGLDVLFDGGHDLSTYPGALDMSCVADWLLPDVVPGQVLERGTVVLNWQEACLEWVSVTRKCGYGVGEKVFGFMESGFEAFAYSACHELRPCKPIFNCFCTTGEMGWTKLSKVEFLTEN